MPEFASPAPPTHIGNYEILSKIAEGGMGTVYRGRHRDTGLIVAIKIIPPTTAKNPILLQRFERGFLAANALDHPNVVKAIEYCGDTTSPFLVMEFVDGESLGQKIEREGPLPEAEAIRLIAQVCKGLHQAHKQGMIHRDVKPDNVMITRDGVAKLTDLGLVRDVDDELNLTRTGRGLGTPHFMAPEQFRNAKHADVRCDIYSLGATLYTLVTGETPFGRCGPLDAWMKKINNDFTPPRQLVPELSERLDWAIRRSMSGDPEQRPASCREFLEDLTGQSTRQLPLPPGAEPPTADLWYLVYRDETGQQYTVKGPVEGIRAQLKEGRLGDATNVRACRTKTGPFQPLKSFPEFRDLVIEPAPAPSPMSGRGSGVIAQPTRTPTGGSDNEAVDLGGPLPAERGASGRLSVSGRRLNNPPSSSKMPPPPTSGKMPKPDAAAVNAEVSGRLPHIPIDDKKRSASSSRGEWLMWLGVLVIALLTALAAFIYLGPRH